MLASSIALAADTAFTYQGSLMESGSPMNGTADIDVSLWDAIAAGSQVGSTQSMIAVPVADGLFSLELDYGAAALDGDRWLEITINGTMLAPRQKVNASPYSIQTRGIFVDDNGRVAIGTPVPTAKLDLRIDDDSTTPAIFVEKNSGTGYAVHVQKWDPNGAGIFTHHRSASGNGQAINARANSPEGIGVYGNNIASSGLAYGIWYSSSHGKT